MPLFVTVCGHLICEGDPGHLLGHRSKKTEDPKMEGDPARRPTRKDPKGT